MYYSLTVLTEDQIKIGIREVAERRYKDRMMQLWMEAWLSGVRKLAKMGCRNPTEQQIRPLAEAASKARDEALAKQDMAEAAQFLHSNNGHGEISEDVIRVKAYEFYLERIKREADLDWHEAESQVRKLGKVFLPYSCVQKIGAPLRLLPGGVFFCEFCSVINTMSTKLPTRYAQFKKYLLCLSH